MVVRETHYFRKPPYTLYPPLHLPCLTFVQLDALHGRLNQLLGIAGVLVAVAAVASHATYFYDGGFQDSCFDESYWKEVQVDKQVISYLYKSNTKKTWPTWLFFVCFFCWFNLLPNWPGQPRQPVLTPSIHPSLTIRSTKEPPWGAPADVVRVWIPWITAVVGKVSWWLSGDFFWMCRSSERKIGNFVDNCCYNIYIYIYIHIVYMIHIRIYVDRSDISFFSSI